MKGVPAQDVALVRTRGASAQMHLRFPRTWLRGQRFARVARLPGGRFLAVELVEDGIAGAERIRFLGHSSQKTVRIGLTAYFDVAAQPFGTRPRHVDWEGSSRLVMQIDREPLGDQRPPHLIPAALEPAA